MANIGPIDRRELIQTLKRLGFEGPHPGGKHEYMRRSSDNARVTIPNPHGGGDIDKNQLDRLLKQAEIKEEWRNL